MRKTTARTAEWSATASKQIVQKQRLAPLVFREGFPRHSTDYIAFLGKTRLPTVLVGQRSKDLRGYRILLIQGQRGDFFQRLLQ
jgi:hypothetical protein